MTFSPVRPDLETPVVSSSNNGQPSYTPAGDDSPGFYVPPLNYGQIDYNVPPAYDPPPAFGGPQTAAPQNVYPQPPYATAPGYPIQGARKGGGMKGRKGAAIGGAILAVAIIGGVVASQNAHKPGTSSGVGFNNPTTLEDALTAKVNERLSDPSGQFYTPGVTVSEDICVLQTAHTFTCVITNSDGDSASTDVVVSADGQSYVTK